MPSLKTPTAFSDADRQVFGLAPADHFLRQVDGRIDFERFRPLLNEAYKPQMGRPPIDVRSVHRGPWRAGQKADRVLMMTSGNADELVKRFRLLVLDASQ